MSDGSRHSSRGSTRQAAPTSREGNASSSPSSRSSGRYVHTCLCRWSSCTSTRGPRSCRCSSATSGRRASMMSSAAARVESRGARPHALSLGAPSTAQAVRRIGGRLQAAAPGLVAAGRGVTELRRINLHIMMLRGRCVSFVLTCISYSLRVVPLLIAMPWPASRGAFYTPRTEFAVFRRWKKSVVASLRAASLRRR